MLTLKKLVKLFDSRRLSIWAVAEIINIDKETIWQILHYIFNMKKVCLKVVPRLLTPEQKEIWMNICADILQNIENDPDFLENVITCDESWFFQYDTESKCQSMHWKSPSSPRQKNARQSKSKFKTMMIVFFDIQGIVYMGWVPVSQTINQVYYKEVLAHLHKSGKEKKKKKKKTWNVEEQLMGSSSRQRAGTQRPVCQDIFDEAQDHHVGTSTILTWPSPVWLFLFPKIKSMLKGTRFEPIDAMKAKATELMNKLSEDNLQHCFQQ